MSLLRCKKGENKWFMRKRNNCCDSFDKIVFQIVIIQIDGGLIASNLCLESRTRV